MKKHNYSIVLFTYKRLETVERIIDVLSEHLFNNIYIISDSVKNPKVEEDIFSSIIAKAKMKLKDRNYQTYQWNNHVGLRYSIMHGLDMVFKHEQNVVILEDDAIPTNNFFELMDHGFNAMSNNSKISHISGYTPLQFSDEVIDKIRFNATSFPSTFAWGTTYSEWKKINVELDLKSYIKVMKINRERHKNLFFNLIFTYNIILMKFEKIDSWAIQWMYSLILNDQYCLIPNLNFVSHEGDKDGTHTKLKPRYINPKPSEGDVDKNFDSILGSQNDSALLKYVYRADFKGLILMTIVFFAKLTKINKRKVNRIIQLNLIN